VIASPPVLNHPPEQCDILIVGGGIVGLATAWHLTADYPERSVVVLEKESTVAAHQTGNNSGVLHSGIYYRPGSLKATNCRAGIKAMVEFCQRENIAHDVCGKVIVACDRDEAVRLRGLRERAAANGVACEPISRARLKELEPHCDGVEALHIPETGIADFRAVCVRLAEIISGRNGQVVTSTKATRLETRGDEILVTTNRSIIRAKYAINCAGLHSDRVTALSGARPSVKIIPFRGEYYELKPDSRKLCRNLIYPVPDIRFPFLGVHFTRMAVGGVECGPNASLAFAREGYRKTHVNLRDLAEILTYPGFLRFALKHWRIGIDEWKRAFSKAAFVKALRRLIPEITEDDLVPAPAGVRAQAVAPDGKLVDDFAIEEQERIVHVVNAPSPAATSALSVGRMIADRLAKRF
jgi:L-2-hydroxyglutarate oxidase